MKTFLVLIVFAFKQPPTNGISEEIRKQTDSLKLRGIEKIIIHQYALFNGRYQIPYDVAELHCNDIPIVAHLFWQEGEQWKCMRLDKCGQFEVLDINKRSVDKIKVDGRIKLKKKSPHFATYTLTTLYSDNRESVSVCATQLTDEHNATIKSIKNVNKLIKELENNHKFKRVQ